MPVMISIGFMKVGAMQSDAGIFFGENMQNGWDSHAKSNISGGQPSGDYNYMPTWVNYLYDPDVIDVPINDQDIKSPTFAHVMGI
ncbi:hypothetical protein JI721_15785 [Alicyclobacillus cycloheptanicus]|uniref:Uncharacterized protein n=1 Tax=Alicyclobacillus cycloheptanicus TaxID=1457 RepID=A0ABT9XF84_9BACL|nr:hypothetical protein [Alicyclobacillus cycloheptanicus]MDQ0188401.1 hypothetical protein [Alicyclobacillus cycloheptanicus]WDM01106.1 hypothetical protein JI721_15785 [Alicyclobacillus cycloheptanicus]